MLNFLGTKPDPNAPRTPAHCTGTRICDESCRVTPRYVVHASAREAFITVGDGDLTLDHWGVNYNLYGQVRGFSDLREAPTDPLLYPGFFANSADNVCPASQPVPVHRVKNLAAGYPFQYRCDRGACGPGARACSARRAQCGTERSRRHNAASPSYRLQGVPANGPVNACAADMDGR